MMTEGKHEETPPEKEDAALWDLLERAPRPKPVSPYFARRVLREVSLLAENRPAASEPLGWLARAWQALRRPPGVAFASVGVAAVLVVVGGTNLYRMHRDLSVSVSRTDSASAEAGGKEAVPPDAVVEVDPEASPAVALSPDPVVSVQDVEIIADLDDVLSREESRLWTEDDTVRF